MAARTERSHGLGIDVFLRYSPIVQELQTNLKRNSRVLEIGPGGVGLAEFFPQQPIIGIDTHIGPLYTRPAYLRLIQASATQIPLADASCDYVVCVDTLEHLPASQRDRAIREALRVTRHKFFIAVPSGRVAALLEKFLYFVLAPVYRLLFHKDLSFLGEHVQNGLPTKESIYRSLSDDRSGVTVQILGNINLGIWFLVMFVDPVVRRITKRTGSGWLCSLLRFLEPCLNFPPTYRTVFVVSKG